MINAHVTRMKTNLKTSNPNPMKVTKILIDNGHGAITPGKCSPDVRLKEYAWTREIARRMSAQLQSLGYQTSLIVPEDTDVSLRDRVARVNAICRAEGGASNCVLVSLHVNASGILPQWRPAHGWSVYIGFNASRNSADLADMLAGKAEEAGLYLRRQYPDKGYWRQSLAMVRDTLCPAVLTENLFMDNSEDCTFLLSEEGMERITRLHVEALDQYCRRLRQAA